jgi:hypothetical protein
VILGYIDQKLKNIYIVDVCEAPHDSIATPTTFIRGVKAFQITLTYVEKKQLILFVILVIGILILTMYRQAPVRWMKYY